MSYFINQKDGVVIYEKLKTNSKNETPKEDVVRTDSSLSIEFFNQSVNSLIGFEADSLLRCLKFLKKLLINQFLNSIPHKNIKTKINQKKAPMNLTYLNRPRNSCSH